MKEWSEKFNSFNSYKGLTYVNWYEAIDRWRLNSEAKILPPIEASLDPILACNLKCEHCNAHKYLEEGRGEGDGLKRTTHALSEELLYSTVNFLGEWGVKAVCFGGGGEPTLHRGLAHAIRLCGYGKMQASVATNGVLFSENLIQAMADYCRWVGISVDAASRETYQIGRKSDSFGTAIENIQALCKKATKKCSVAFKFLIFDYNQHEIYEACKLAKELGARDFHARPADLSHQGMGEFKNKARPFDVDGVLKQFEKCRELEDDDFKVFTVVHKFDTRFVPLKNFSQCYAAPCCVQLCADGNVYFCPDQRYQEFYKLGSFKNPADILEFWGKERHHALTFAEGRAACSTRCTWGPYCEQCERLFINKDDPMCRYFI